MGLPGRVVLVTGASSGIGAAVAEQVAAAGALVGLVGRDEARLARVAAGIAEHGGRALALPADVTERAAVRRVVEEVTRELGVVDVLVNNAGLSVWQHMVNADQDSWDAMVDTNIRGTLNCIAAVLPGMVARRSGYIVNMSSVRGVVAGSGGAVYCGTKHFLEGLSAALRLEVAGQGVRVSTVQPTLVDTPLVTTNLAGADVAAVEERRAAMARMAGAMLRPADVARSVLFLLEQPEHVIIPSLPVHACAQSFS